MIEFSRFQVLADLKLRFLWRFLAAFLAHSGRPFAVTCRFSQAHAHRSPSQSPALSQARENLKEVADAENMQFGVMSIS